MIDKIIRVGDAVRHKVRKDRMVVLIVHENKAWCQLVDGEAAGLLVLVELPNLVKIAQRY